MQPEWRELLESSWDEGMGYNEAEAALQKLEQLPPYDAEEGSRNSHPHARLVVECLDRIRKYCNQVGTPVQNPWNVDPTESLMMELPDEFRHRLNRAMENRSGLCLNQRFCELHLRYLCFKEKISEGERELYDVFSPVFAVILNGGLMWLDSAGLICVGEATVPLARLFRDQLEE